MDNNNNNQILDVLEGWPSDVYGFLRGTRPNGLNLWVTFMLEDRVGLNDTNDEKQSRLPDIWEREQNEIDEEQKWVNEEEQNETDEKQKWVNEEEEQNETDEEQKCVNEEEEHYNPYLRLYADCEDWGYGDGMPETWRQ
ncbi:ribosomal biogenesis protein LAS1L-like [Mizuhopecten yessoensis]|uniref:Uncharacterized protein n=1 Tax=Mizuhopecten yessoensis TaxID=6573 RepID=A0A210PMU9_MIZYE|nr:ribosomal biogenesis protein LAS1L-like [Mizuhopecten yessoensis]OWF37819.1 hypothetical protein KP79_PYT06018 [Mizuhopecten yessoensis]